MKKIIFLSAVVLLLASCASTKIDVSQISPMAIVSIKGNSSLVWYENKGDKPVSSSQGLISRAIDNHFYYDDPEIATAQERLDFAEETLRKVFAENLGVEILEKNQVVDLKSYKQINEGFLSGMNTSIAATDYKVLDSASSMELRKLHKELGSKGAIILKFDFFKKVTAGSKTSGYAVPKVYMRAKIYNEKGKEIFSKSYDTEGTEKFRITKREYDKEEFVKLYPEVIESLINRFALDLML